MSQQEWRVNGERNWLMDGYDRFFVFVIHVLCILISNNKTANFIQNRVDLCVKQQQ